MKRTRAPLVSAVLALVALATLAGCMTSASKGWAQTSAPLEQAAGEADLHLGVTGPAATPPHREQID